MLNRPVPCAMLRTMLLVVMVSAGCAPAPTVQTPTLERPAGFSIARYIDAHERGEPVFRLASDSLAIMRVYRGGTLARLGHDHVVASRNVRGYVLVDEKAVRADLYVPLALLSVDEPALRAQAGFDTQPSQPDIDATRRNMTDKVLEVERFPFVVLHLTAAEGGAGRTLATVEMILHGVARSFTLPIDVERPSAQALYASGKFSINQTDFGIKPYSVLGGVLQVQDRVDIEFRLHAARVARGQVLDPGG